MKYGTLAAGLFTVALLLGSAPAYAQDKAPAAHPTKTKSAKKPARPAKIIDINTATKPELMKLSGIGDSEADRIIAGRPYHSKADLTTRKIVPTGIYLQIRRKIMAKPQPGPAPKTAETKR